MSLAAAAMAFASCEMVVENSVPQDGYVYTFTLSSADETKAAIGENSVVWEDGDQMGVYTISTSGTSYNRYGDITPGTPATMEISSFYALSAGDMVYTYYPYTSNNSKEATTVSMSIPTSQDGKDDMPMVSLPIAMASDLAEKTDMSLPAGELKFVNLGAVIEFKVYTDTDAYADEVVKSVSFESDKAIAGNFTYDITAVDYSDKTTLQIPALTDNKVVAPVNNVTVGTRENPIVVNMVVAPGSYTGNVVVTTDKATYTYSITEAKEFVRSAIKPLGLNLRENVRTENLVDDKKTDVLTRELTGVAAGSSVYTEWSVKSFITNAVYAGQSAGSNNAIQLRSDNSNSGIITTSSGGYVSKVEVSWNANTTNGRTLNIYGRSTSYSSPTELYSPSYQGTLIGTIVCGQSTELIVKGNYEYIGLCSDSGAMYIDEICVTWTDVAQEMSPLVSISVSGQTTEFKVNQVFEFDGVVTATYQDGSSKKVAPTSLSSPNMSEVGTPTVVVSYTEGQITKTFEYEISVTKTTESWVKVKSLNDIVSGEYIIVAKTSSKTGYLPSTTTSSAPSYVTSISISGNEVVSVTDEMKFIFDVKDGKVTITNAAGKYLYMTNDNNGVRISTTNFTWKISNHDVDGTFKFTSDSPARFLGVYNNQDWRCYTTYNATNFTKNTGSSAIYLYKKSN